MNFIFYITRIQFASFNDKVQVRLLDNIVLKGTNQSSLYLEIFIENTF